MLSWKYGLPNMMPSFGVFVALVAVVRAQIILKITFFLYFLYWFWRARFFFNLLLLFHLIKFDSITCLRWLNVFRSDWVQCHTRSRRTRKTFDNVKTTYTFEILALYLTRLSHLALSMLKLFEVIFHKALELQVFIFKFAHLQGAGSLPLFPESLELVLFGQFAGSCLLSISLNFLGCFGLQLDRFFPLLLNFISHLLF